VEEANYLYSNYDNNQMRRSCLKWMAYPRNCFDMYGVDFLVDHEGHPWLVEVNTGPDMSGWFPMDHRLKSMLIREVVRIVQGLREDEERLKGGEDVEDLDENNYGVDYRFFSFNFVSLTSKSTQIIERLKGGEDVRDLDENNYGVDYRFFFFYFQVAADHRRRVHCAGPARGRGAPNTW